MKRICRLTITLSLAVSSICLANPMNNSARDAVIHNINKTTDVSPIMDFVPGEGLMLHNEDGTMSALFNYLMQTDSAWMSNNPTFSNAVFIPLSKAYLSVNLKQTTVYMSYDFAQTVLDQANVGYSWKQFNMQAGQIEPYFGLVNDVADNAYNFIATPLNVAAFSPNYSEGLVFQANTAHFVQQGTLFGQSADTDTTRTATLNATLRTLFVPYHEKYKVLHFALNAWTETVGAPHQAQFFSLPELNAQGAAAMVDTESIPNVSNYQVFDGEFVALKGPFNIQSEYTYTMVHRIKPLPSVHFNGYYVTASYFLTGESRDYQYPDGYFIGITKIHHDYGAIQLLARFSSINLNDKDIQGGAEHDYGVGLNWYSSKMTELSFNYIYAVADPNYQGNRQASNVYALRFQIGL